MNWQAYTDRMNAWRALNPGATPEEHEAASFAIERDVENKSRRARVAPEQRIATSAALASSCVAPRNSSGKNTKHQA